LTVYLIRVEDECDDDATERTVTHVLEDEAALQRLIDVQVSFESEEAKGYECVLKYARPLKYPCLLVSTEAHFDPLMRKSPRSPKWVRYDGEDALPVWRTESFVIFYKWAEIPDQFLTRKAETNDERK